MFSFLCKVIGHKFQYLNRYYRCTRCGVRRCDIAGNETITDGFGSSAPLVCPTCHMKSMYVCRPGDFRCHVCYDGNNVNDYAKGN